MTLARPRVTVFHVLKRTVMRLVDIQVWDQAGSMTFYLLLSVFPAGIALVSMVSVLGLATETLGTFSELVAEVFPSVDAAALERGLMTLSTTGGGIVGLVLGTVGALIAASNGVASFHRATHRIYDTREGRPFLYFRLIVFLETIAMILAVVVMIVMVVIGEEASEALGAVLGIPQASITAWNVLKWPTLLVLLVLMVSLAYYRGPNAKLPRYRAMSVGSILSVLVLYLSAVLIGWLAANMGRFGVVFGALNGTIIILVLLWLANIVLIGGAALDAELLRARQIAVGIAAWDRIQLPTRSTRTLEFLERDRIDAEEIAHVVADAARSGDPATIEGSLWIAEADTAFAIDAPEDGIVGGDGPGPVRAERREEAATDRDA